MIEYEIISEIREKKRGTDGDEKLKIVREQEKQHGENCQLMKSKQTVNARVLEEKRQAFL